MRRFARRGNKIWDSLIKSKLYLTGGVGAAGGHEGFGDAYDLPNMTAYNETCASIGMDYWNHRQFLLNGDAKYIDIMERTLYNGLISGVSLQGDTFFYPNRLESNGGDARQAWFGVACCPGNITRFIASVPGYIYAKKAAARAGDTDALYVNLFAGGTADVDLAGGKLQVTQTTRYPVGRRRQDRPRARQATPLHRQRAHPRMGARSSPCRATSIASATRRRRNRPSRSTAAPIPLTLANGYVAVTRTWNPGDAIDLTLPMPVRRIVAHASVAADRDRVALQRGPIVYAAEWPDNPNGKVRNIVLPDANAMTAEFRADLLNGVQVIKGRALGLSYDEKGGVQKAEQPFMAIPYATWANRGRGQMSVWLARVDAASRPTPYPTAASTSTLTHSASTKRIANIIDGEDPRASNDSTSYFDWWPRNGCAPTAAGADTPAGAGGQGRANARPAATASGSRWRSRSRRQSRKRRSTGSTIPAAVAYAYLQSWRLLYKDGADWKPVEAAGEYGVARDAYNTVRFKPVTTSALRLELVMQPGVSAGVQEWKVK